MTTEQKTVPEKRASGRNLITEGASLFAETDRHAGEVTPRHQAITELMVCAFAGQVPDDKTLMVLREGSKSSAQRRKVPGGKVQIDLIENFQLPDDNEAAHKYVDTLLANGADEYRVWASIQAATEPKR